MGLFDTIHICIICPACGEKHEMGCQTKELDCFLRNYQKGDYVGTEQFNYVTATADCQSAPCKAKMETERGRYIGWGHLFEVKIFLDKGHVTGEYQILPTPETSNGDDD